jgi:hypothetical protein
MRIHLIFVEPHHGTKRKTSGSEFLAKVLEREGMV